MNATPLAISLRLNTGSHKQDSRKSCWNWIKQNGPYPNDKVPNNQVKRLFKQILSWAALHENS
jgi:hypothetical protein